MKLVIPYHYSHLSLYRIASGVHTPFGLFLPGQCATDTMLQQSPSVDSAASVPAPSSAPAGWQRSSDFPSFLGAPLLRTALDLLLASERKAASLPCPQKLGHPLAATER